ncbi:hypothetical protein, partial [Streptomyces sp. NPDC000851]
MNADAFAPTATGSPNTPIFPAVDANSASTPASGATASRTALYVCPVVRAPSHACTVRSTSAMEPTSRACMFIASLARPWHRASMIWIEDFTRPHDHDLKRALAARATHETGGPLRELQDEFIRQAQEGIRLANLP